MDKQEFLLRMGNRIKELRATKGINQAELARRCDKERASIERIENGKINPSIFVLYEISLGLEVHIKEILDFKIE